MKLTKLFSHPLLYTIRRVIVLFSPFVVQQILAVVVCIKCNTISRDCRKMCAIIPLSTPSLPITNFSFHHVVWPLGTTVNTLAFILSDSNPAHISDWVSRRVWRLSHVAKPSLPPPTHQRLEPSALDETCILHGLEISILTHIQYSCPADGFHTDHCVQTRLKNKKKTAP